MYTAIYTSVILERIVVCYALSNTVRETVGMSRERLLLKALAAPKEDKTRVHYSRIIQRNARVMLILLRLLTPQSLIARRPHFLQRCLGLENVMLPNCLRLLRSYCKLWKNRRFDTWLIAFTDRYIELIIYMLLRVRYRQVWWNKYLPSFVACCLIILCNAVIANQLYLLLTYD